MGTLLVVAAVLGADILTPPDRLKAPADTLKVPAFVIRVLPDTLPVPKPKRDYTACLKAIKDGGRVFLAVGVEPEDGDYSVAELEWGDGSKVEPGRYECWLYDGKPSWRPVRKVLQSLPAVQFTGPFGGGLRIGGS